MTGRSALSPRSISPCASESTSLAGLLVGHFAPGCVGVALGEEEAVRIALGRVAEQPGEARLIGRERHCRTQAQAAVGRLLADDARLGIGNRTQWCRHQVSSRRALWPVNAVPTILTGDLKHHNAQWQGRARPAAAGREAQDHHDRREFRSREPGDRRPSRHRRRNPVRTHQGQEHRLHRRVSHRGRHRPDGGPGRGRRRNRRSSTRSMRCATATPTSSPPAASARPTTTSPPTASPRRSASRSTSIRARSRSWRSASRRPARR